MLPIQAVMALSHIPELRNRFKMGAQLIQFRLRCSTAVQRRGGATAATNMPNKFPAYIGGWNNGDAKGLQAEYQKGGIPIKVLHDALQTIHAVEDWGRERANLHQDEWT